MEIISAWCLATVAAVLCKSEVTLSTKSPFEYAHVVILGYKLYYGYTASLWTCTMQGKFHALIF